VVDSVNIGLSLNAEDGIDPIDEFIDNDLELPFSVAIYNPLLQNQYGNDTTCAYLKSSYANFPEQTLSTSTGDIVKEWIIVFRSDDDFVSSDFNGSCSNPQQIYGMTLQVNNDDLFAYQFINDQGYYVRYINLDGYNVYISGIDGYDQTFTISNSSFGCIPIIRGDSGNIPFGCQNNADDTFYAFKLKMAISNKFWTSIIEEQEIPIISVNENQLTVNNNNIFNSLQLYNIQGQLIQQSHINIGRATNINIKANSKEIIIIRFSNEAEKLFTIIKTIVN